ncbi:hypothetical protein [Methylocucumis oryzae]|uniref:Uncharacterized protein n=1 Tax=Methylocucumis oryzae TaxID=1632867 RepID=A0A0F3IQX9_9GAMM|nr:hypothetical protein [Methylocucumis oryzae]KJV08014.1 hypothetical protein VZ94_00945 [Methylocucumis oryzae]
MNEILDRKTAIKTGKTHYYTGIPCKRGHLSLRYTNTSNRVECLKEKVYAERLRIKAVKNG